MKLSEFGVCDRGRRLEKKRLSTAVMIIEKAQGGKGVGFQNKRGGKAVNPLAREDLARC